MVCTTVRKGVECAFMTAKGCSYNSGTCYQATEACNGCNRRAEFSTGWYCTAVPEPSMKWKNGNCNLASHITAQPAEAAKKINPIKASKRSKK
ncbi:PxxKW family cysteine-rich protein [Desulfococcaceae bacterium HSG8]|nr:PxxKW family cysteine-rich protein [Desulfococcaceae bacterium HSG8]